MPFLLAGTWSDGKLTTRIGRNSDPVRLLGYQRGPRGWRRLRLNAQGRLDLAPIGMLLGSADDRPWLYDTVTGIRAPDRTEWQHVLTATETRAQEAETRARAAETRAQEEAQARAALEARVQALEAQLRCQQGAQ